MIAADPDQLAFLPADDVPAAKAEAPRWALTPHVCRHCLSRVLNRGEEYLCASCEARCVKKPAGICGCGIPVTPRRLADKRPLRFQCAPNPAISHEAPAVYVVVLDGEPAGPE